MPIFVMEKSEYGSNDLRVPSIEQREDCSGGSRKGRCRSSREAAPEVLNLTPQLRPRILGIQLRQLAQQLFCLLIPRHRHRDLDFYDFVTPHSILRRRGHALLAQPQLLSGLRPGGNLQQRPSVNGRDFDLPAQGSLGRRDRHVDINVVTSALKHRVFPRSNHDIKIPGGPAMHTGIAFARDPDALPIPRSCLDPDFERLGALDWALAMAHRAGRNVLARSVAAPAGDVELHPAPGLGHGSFAAALRTCSRRLHVTLPVAMRAGIAPGDIQSHDPAPDGRPERNIDLVLQIRARLRPFGFSLASPTTEHPGEDVFETAAPAGAGLLSPPAFEQVRKVEPTEVEVNVLAATRLARSGEPLKPARAGLASAARISLGCSRINVVGIEPELVVDLTLLGIAQNVVGLGDGLELLLRGLVPGIYIGMVLARQLAEGLANLFRRRRFLDPQRPVIIFRLRGQTLPL